MKVYIARHGQTTGDIDGRYGGDYDDHLTELGEQQADGLGELLKSEGLDRMFASPLTRARETAEVVRKHIGLAALVLDDFKERNSYGVVTGMTRDEALAQFPEAVEELEKNGRLSKVEGSEPIDDFRERVLRGVKKLSQRPFKSVGLVTHAGPIRIIFRDILGVGEIEVDDCGVFKLIINENEGSYSYDYELISGIRPVDGN